MSFFESKYGRTYYISEGEQHKNTPLIGIHGGPGGFHQTILPVLDLKSDRRVILYDQIGTGQSERIERDLWIIDTYTENLNELMDHLGEDNSIRNRRISAAVATIRSVKDKENISLRWVKGLENLSDPLTKASANCANLKSVLATGKPLKNLVTDKNS